MPWSSMLLPSLEMEVDSSGKGRILRKSLYPPPVMNIMSGKVMSIWKVSTRVIVVGSTPRAAPSALKFIVPPV